MELVADYKYLHSTYLPNTIIKQVATHIHIQLVIVVNMYLHLQLHYIVCSIYPLQHVVKSCKNVHTFRDGIYIYILTMCSRNPDKMDLSPANNKSTKTHPKPI